MKTIILKNPEQAQQIFIKNGWTDQANYFIQVESNTSLAILNAESYSPNVEGNCLRIRFGSTYDIPLNEFENEVILELNDIDGLGVMLFINQTPYCLRVYRMSDEKRIKQIGELYPYLRIVDFGSSKNEGVKNLDGIVACSNLQALNLGYCKNLVDISGLKMLNHLEILWLDGFKDSSQFHFISSCKMLVKLSQADSQLESIEHISGLDLIEVLAISGNSRLTDLSPLSGLNVLTKLDLSYCDDLTDLSPLSELSALAILEAIWCRNLSDLSPLSGLNVLVSLNLTWCSNLIDLSPLSRMSKLTNLNLNSCGNLTDLSPLSGLNELASLDLGWCTNLSDLSPLSGLSTLINLNLSYCYNLTDLSPLSGLNNLTNLNLSICENLTDLSPLSGLNELASLDLGQCSNLIDLSPLSGMSALTNLSLNSCEKLTDFSPLSSLSSLIDLSLINCAYLTDLTPLSGLSSLVNLNLTNNPYLTDLTPLSGLSSLMSLDLTNCKNIIRVSNFLINKILIEINLNGCSNIRDFENLSSLPNLKKLEWIDSVACSLVLMQSATNRQDSKFVRVNAKKWIAEIELSKDAIDYLSKLLRTLSLLKDNYDHEQLIALSNAMRSRGLQSEGLNDLDAFIWETWCNLVLELELHDAINCLKTAVTDLDIQKETEVLLGPVIIAASELVEKHPSEKLTMMAWVNEQLQQIQDYPVEERQIAPSAAVFFASLNMKEEVLFWLEKATDQKAPLWRDKLLAALINYYAQKEEFAECRRLLDLIEIEEQRDKAISSIAVAMGEQYPVEAAFLIDEIKELSISTATANKLLHQPSVLNTSQGIYQLLLHLQSNPEELALTIETLIEKDQDGKVAYAIKQLFLQKQPTGPSAAVLLELCQHPSISNFVKPRALEKYKANLQDRFKEECAVSVSLLLAEMQQEEMIDEEEAVELLKLMQQS